MHNSFLLQLTCKLVLSLGVSSNYYDWKNLLTVLFFAYSNCTCICEPDILKLYQYLVQLETTNNNRLIINIMVLGNHMKDKRLMKLDRSVAKIS